MTALMPVLCDVRPAWPVRTTLGRFPGRMCGVVVRGLLPRAALAKLFLPPPPPPPLPSFFIWRGDSGTRGESRVATDSCGAKRRPTAPIPAAAAAGGNELGGCCCHSPETFVGELKRRACLGGPLGEDMLSQTLFRAPLARNLRLLKPVFPARGSICGCWTRAKRASSESVSSPGGGQPLSKRIQTGT